MSTTTLDGDHVLRQVYDPPTESLKTLITANISGAQEVIINSVDDSITIGDASGNKATVVGGALNVTGTFTGSSTVTGTVNTNLNGLAAFKTTQYTVGTSAVQLTPTPLTNRSSLDIKVVTTTNTDAVYIGTTSAVTTATGFPLFNGDSVQLDLTTTQTIYAIGTASGQLVYVLELG